MMNVNAKRERSPPSAESSPPLPSSPEYFTASSAESSTTKRRRSTPPPPREPSLEGSGSGSSSPLPAAAAPKQDWLANHWLAGHVLPNPDDELPIDREYDDESYEESDKEECSDDLGQEAQDHPPRHYFSDESDSDSDWGPNYPSGSATDEESSGHDDDAALEAASDIVSDDAGLVGPQYVSPEDGPPEPLMCPALEEIFTAERLAELNRPT